MTTICELCQLRWCSCSLMRKTHCLRDFQLRTCEVILSMPESEARAFADFRQELQWLYLYNNKLQDLPKGIGRQGSRRGQGWSGSSPCSHFLCCVVSRFQVSNSRNEKHALFKELRAQVPNPNPNRLTE